MDFFSRDLCWKFFWAGESPFQPLKRGPAPVFCLIIPKGDATSPHHHKLHSTLPKGQVTGMNYRYKSTKVVPEDGKSLVV